jgi:hypothetical protein
VSKKHSKIKDDDFNDDNQFKLLIMEAIETKMKLEAEYYLELQATSTAKHLCATFDDFFKGPEAFIGIPNPKVRSGMKEEHCSRGNAMTRFTTSNYNMTTTPKIEWDFVVCPKQGFEYPHTPKERSKWRSGNEWVGSFGRDVKPLQEFLETPQTKQAGLIEEEVIALRLATGPMFILYNAVLRNYPEKDVACLVDIKTGKENRYETTIFVIASGISKLSKLSGVPEDRRLYRGLDAVLPRQFREDFSECQITFEITTSSSRSSADDPLAEALQSLNSFTVPFMPDRRNVNTKAVTTSLSVMDKYLQLDLPPDFGDAVTQGVRVVKEAHLSEDTVQMTVALPLAKFEFLETMEEAFIRSLEALCLGCAVKIDNNSISNKPENFRGSGAC